MLSISCCCKDKRNARHPFQSLHFHSKISLRVAFSKCPSLAVTVILYLSLYLLLRSCITLKLKRISVFQFISQERYSLPPTPAVLLLAQLVNEYSQSRIFQLGRRFSVTLDIILNEKNMHKVFDSYYAREKIGNAFLKYSQKMDYCFSCGWVLFTNVFPPNNTHLPVFTFIYQQKKKTHPLKSSKQP